MGTVYLAHDPKLDRNVALKVPKFAGDEDREMLERFFREARSVASLRHPNLCPVYDVAEDGAACYFTMSYIEGPPLSIFTQAENLLTPRRAAAAIRKIARGVEAAHRKGVIHRDLKPSNIMIDREHGEPVVMDFGLARSMWADESNITHLGKILGTPSYMSPEQVEGDFEQIGPGTDIYSLGVVLYQLLTGRLPFEGPVSRVLVLIQTQSPEPPSVYRPNLDPLLESICLKAMAKRAVDRYDSMRQFGNTLAAYLKQTKHQASSPGTVRISGGTAPESVIETQSVAGDEQAATLNDRILNPGSEPLTELGFGEELRAEIQDLISRGPGVLLACGPAASGATTTACAIVRSIDTYQYSIFSLGAAGAFELPHVEPYQADPADTVARSLHRCAHLFEPDIIFLDPLRDAADAKAVFLCEDEVTIISEFAAFDAAAGIVQLMQWTGRPELVANRLLGICSQRLIRRLCPDCREPFRPNPAILSKVGLPESVNRLYRTPRPTATGSSAEKCPTCGGAGYAGQTGLFELIRMSEPMKQVVAGTPTLAAIRAQARKEKMPRFQPAALDLVVEGQTSVDELRRVFKGA